MKPFNYNFNRNSLLKIGFRSPGLKHLSAIEKMNFAVELGMSVIEPQIVPKEINSVKKAREYKKAADDTGIKVKSTGSILAHFGTDDQFYESIERTMEYMNALDVKYCFTVIKNEHDAYSSKEAWDLTIERSRMIAEKFEKNNWIYAIEVDKNCFISTLERMKKLISHVDCDNIYINYDPTNYYLNGEDPVKVFKTFKNRIISGHIKDGIRGQKEADVGDGELDYYNIFNAMVCEENEYSMFIEHCSSEERIRKSAEFVKGVLDNYMQNL